MKSVTATKKIRVAIATRTALKAIGQKGESYDAVIRRLMRYWLEFAVQAKPEVLKELLDIEEEVKE